VKTPLPVQVGTTLGDKLQTALKTPVIKPATVPIAVISGHNMKSMKTV